MPAVSPDTFVQALTNKAADLTAKKAADLAAATVHLFTNDFQPTADSVIADFSEATFTGYAAVAVTAWNANGEPGGGIVVTDATNVMTWVGPGDGTGQTIFGYYVLSAGAGTPLIYAARLPVAVGLNTVADVLALVATFGLR